MKHWGGDPAKLYQVNNYISYRIRLNVPNNWKTAKLPKAPGENVTCLSKSVENVSIGSQLYNCIKKTLIQTEESVIIFKLSMDKYVSILCSNNRNGDFYMKVFFRKKG